MRAVFDGICLLHSIQRSFQSIQQNIAYVLGAQIPTNAIFQSFSFGIASGGQFLNKQLFGNRPFVAYDAVHGILSSYTINHGSESLEANKLYRSNYELKSNFVITFSTGVTNTSFKPSPERQIISSLFFTCY
ncbi:MAG: hypothetical protein EZS28_028346 [Streblomastix strix]|uniref:Uncharacterized protein n=1 Tax=Streblomastix strix TaxID=222440 RepID=A0A5J4V0J7_9EUKA|nr:MAG: hypothetical protein EZS28_028346 [Streblomastix strix]